MPQFCKNEYQPLKSALYGFAVNDIMRVNGDTEEYFYVSYQPSAGKGIFDNDGSKPETALCCINKVTDAVDTPKTSYHILSGDFRLQYQAVADTGSTDIDDYMSVFNKYKPTHFCNFSSGPEYE
ncbi:MAG TPA: hypothetical protein VEP90_15235 [Methylomirabilota bacterium]|nr:hypothetical protein [Methylomirabilota bacterium]